MKYNAFISYSHQQDTDLSAGIEKSLEKFAKPAFKRRALSIFRDANHLSAASDLGEKIRMGLANSDYFICLASRAYARSKWCKREIEYWLENKSMDHFLIGITDGEVIWDENTHDFDWEKTNALPDIVSNKFSGEPLYVDFRGLGSKENLTLENPQFKERLVMLGATIHNKTVADLTGEAARNHKRLMLIRNFTMGILAILLGLSILQTINAKRQTEIAHTNFLISEAKFMAIDDPTIGLRLAQEALKRDRSFNNIRDATKIYWENTFYKILARYQTPKTSIKFLPDGKGLLAVGNDSLIHKIDFQGNSTILIDTGGGPLSSLAVSADSEQILVGSYDGLVRVYDLSGQMINQFSNPAATGVSAAIFVPGKDEIVLGSEDGMVFRMNLDGDLLRTYKGHKAEITALAYSNDGSYFVTASYNDNGKAIIWSSDGTQRGLINHRDVINCVAISPDGEKIFTGSTSYSDAHARISSPDGESLYAYQNLDAEITSAEFSADGKHILIGSFDPIAHIYDLEGRMIKEFIGHTRGAISVGYSPDGKKIVSSSHDNTVRIWGIKGMAEQVYEDIPGDSYSINYSPTGDTLMSCSSEQTLLLGIAGNRLMDFSEDEIGIVRYSPNGKYLAIGYFDGMLKLTNIQTLESIQIEAHEDEIRSIGFSPTGDSLITGSWDGTARLWTIKGESFGPVYRHEVAVSMVSFTPSGKQVMTGRINAYLWDLKGNKISEFLGNEGEVVSINFSPDGDLVFTASTDGIGRLWDMNGEQKVEFFGHKGMLFSGDFSPRGDAVVTVSGDDTARLWDLNGATLQGFIGHKDHVLTVAFSPDGKEIITGSRDNTIRRWKLAPSLDEFLMSGDFQELSAELRLKYQLD